MPQQMATAKLSSMIGSSVAITRNTWTLPVISIASFSYCWTRYTRISRSPIAPIYLLTTMQLLLAVASRAIRSASARYSKRGTTPRLERQVPLSHRDRSSPAPSRQEGNGSPRDL